jgi:hypothetical protein
MPRLKMIVVSSPPPMTNMSARYRAGSNTSARLDNAPVIHESGVIGCGPVAVLVDTAHQPKIYAGRGMNHPSACRVRV